MPKRSVSDFGLAGVTSYLTRQQFYKASHIDQILAETNGLPSGMTREAFALRLEEIAHEWLLDNAPQTWPTDIQLAEALGGIAVAANTLIKRLHASEDGDLSTVPLPIRNSLESQASSRALNEWQLDQCILEIARLRQFAEAQREIIAARAEHSGSSTKSKDTALQKLLEKFGEIWQSDFGRKLAGTANGPTVQFIQACIAPLPIQLSNEAVRSYVRELKNMGK